MAYGNPKRRREHEPDVHELVEDAAREAGLSVSAFLEQASAEHEDEQERRRRKAQPRRQLRLVDENDSPLEMLERRLSRPATGEALSEDRVAGILERAFSEIRASEARTSQLIESLAQNLPNGTAERRPPQSVAEILASAERRSRAQHNIVALPSARAAVGDRAFDDAAAGVSGIVQRLQEGVSRGEVEKALQLLERQLSMVEPQSVQDQMALRGMAAEIASIRSVVTADGAQVPLSAIEGPIGSLTHRIGAMAAAPHQAASHAQPPPHVRAAPYVQPVAAAQPSVLSALDRRLDEVTATTTAMVAGIQDELVRLGRNGLKRDDTALEASFDRLESRIHQLEQASRGPLEQIRHEIMSLQDSPGRRDGDQSLRQSIDGLEHKLEQLTDRIARPLQMVHNAVTHLSRQKAQGPVDDGRLDQLFSELTALKRGIAENSTGAGFSGMERQLSAISERIESIAHRMQQEAQPDGPKDLRRKPIDDEIAEIKLLISAAKSPCDDTKVLDAIGQLERKIAALENSPQALMERLDRLHARLDERPAAGGTLPPNVEVLLRNLAARLEAPSIAPVVDDSGLDRLQQEIRTLATKLERAPAPMAAPAPLQDLSAVERSIGDLFRQIDGLKSEVGEKAARAAVDAIRDMQPSMHAAAPSAPVHADTSHIEASLGQLRQLQTDAEQRTTRTLEALHDTLHRVVDRLSSMEREARAPAAAALHAPLAHTPPLHAPAQQPPVFAGPPMVEPPQQAAPMFAPEARRPVPQEDSINLLPPDILEPRTEQASGRSPIAAQTSPVQASLTRARPDAMLLPTAAAADGAGARSFAETLASLRANPAAPPEPRPETRSAMASAFAAAKDAMANLRGAKADTAADRIEPPAIQPPAGEPAPKLQQAAPEPALDFDMPLEPGSGRPRPGMRVQPPQQGAGAASDAKADFLAAARRAAQAAAQQSAEVLAQTDARSTRKARAGLATAELAAAADSTPKGAGFRAKHAILLGVAALVVAAGAGYQFMGPPKRVEAPASEPPQRSSALAPPARPALQAEKPAQSAPQQTATVPTRPALTDGPRQILPPPLTPEPQRAPERQAERRETPALAAPAPGPQIAAPPAAPARDEPQSVGSIPAPDRVPAGISQPQNLNDPMFRFEGLKDAPKLREAARKGDPSAFVELGQRYADGRNATRDPKTAALWFEKAAEHGSAPAQYRLGTMHREGRGVERNPKAALRHFSAAAEAGNARAMHNTAVLLAEGVNGAPDYAGAGEWFRKAAEFGIRDSQYNLAILHARGLGVSQDLMASYAWFSAAAANGDEDAAKKRDEVGSRMPPERLQQARAAAAQWKAKTPDPAANEIIAPPGGWDGDAKQPPAAANPPKAGAKRG
jgi:localization factor PodJL